MNIPIREFQLSPKKWLALLTDDGADLINGEGKLLAHIRPRSERSLILTRLNDIEALLNRPSPDDTIYGPVLDRMEREAIFEKLKGQLGRPGEVVFPTCDKCTLPCDDLKQYFEDGEEFQVCLSCLTPKKK